MPTVKQGFHWEKEANRIEKVQLMKFETNWNEVLNFRIFGSTLESHESWQDFS